MTAPHVWPSTKNTGSAPATFRISWLNPTPHTIAVYASPLPSPAAPQHSLAGGRYPLPAPDFHRLDRTSFAWRTLRTCYFPVICISAPCIYAQPAGIERLSCRSGRVGGRALPVFGDYQGNPPCFGRTTAAYETLAQSVRVT